MPTLLDIDSSPLAEASISRQLTAEFVRSWKLANPDGKVVTRDLATTSISPISAAWVGAAYATDDARTPEQRSLLTHLTVKRSLPIRSSLVLPDRERASNWIANQTQLQPFKAWAQREFNAALVGRDCIDIRVDL